MASAAAPPSKSLPEAGAAGSEEAQPLLVATNKGPAAAAAAATTTKYGSTAAGPTEHKQEEEDECVVVTITTHTTTASSAFGLDDEEDYDPTTPLSGPSLLLSTLLPANDHNNDATTTCRACRQLGAWAAVLLAGLGALTGGLIAPHFGWPRPILLLVLAPCVLLAALPLAPALRRAVALRRIDTTVLASVGILAALLLGHAGLASAMLLLTLLAESVKAAAGAHVLRALGGHGGRGRVGRRVPQIARRRPQLPPGASNDDEQEELVPLSALTDGDTIVVKAGETLPVDGEVVGAGRGVVEEAGMTGDAMPAEKREGSVVLAGSVLRSGTLHIRYTPSLSLYTQMEAEAGTMKREGGPGVVDRMSGWLCPLILGAALVLAVVPEAEYALRHGKRFSLPAALTHLLELLALSTPIALTMAAPLPYLTTLAASIARGGVVIKTPLALERLGRLQVLALDKTGTLTDGRFHVSGRHQLASSTLPLALVRRLAACVEKGVAHHRLAAAVVEDGEGIEGVEGGVMVASLLELDGMGVEALCLVHAQEGHKPVPYKVVVGSAFLLEDEEREELGLQAFLEGHPNEAHLFVVVNGRPELALSLTDPVRPEAVQAIAGLHALGIETALLTGDRPDAALAVQAKTGVQSAQGRMGHEAKRVWVWARQVEPPPSSLIVGPKPTSSNNTTILSALPSVITEEGESTDSSRPSNCLCAALASTCSRSASAEQQGADDDEEQGNSHRRCRRTHVGMVGDGANDAPALAAAEVGIAVCGPGASALAVEAADVVVLLPPTETGGKGSLLRIPQAVDLAVGVRAVVLENAALALGGKYICLLILLVGCAAWQKGLGTGGRSRLWMGVASDVVALALVVANGLRPLWLARRAFK